MSLFIFGDNASSTMASGITNAQTTVTVQTGNGAFFPAPAAGQILAVTFEDTSGNLEVAYCTGITGDVLTVIRGAETIPSQAGGPALAFASGSRVEARVTKGMLASLLQKNGGDTLTGTTNLSGVLALGSSGSMQGGEFTGALRGAPAQTANQILVPVGTGPATQAGSPILTTANVNSNLPAGYGLVPAGTIMLWYGSSGSVPAGYSLCDGGTHNSYVTPNLQNQFVVGAGSGFAQGSSGGSSSTITGSTDPLTAGGAYTILGHSLTVAELPVHGHTMWTGGFAGATGSGIVTLLNSGTQQFNFPSGEPGISGHQMIGNATNDGSTFASGTAHSHSTSGNLAHTHTYSLPPYYALFYIMRTA